MGCNNIPKLPCLPQTIHEKVPDGGELTDFELLLVDVLVDDTLGPIVGRDGPVLVVVDLGRLDIIERAVARLLAVELAAGPLVEVLDVGVEALDTVLSVQDGVALLFRLPVLRHLVLGRDVELARLGNNARGEHGHDGEEGNFETQHVDGSCFT
ncbi:hypothetical protein PGQ11_014485 [Apiospora arundinis]|uniref:Uncharacterized protein n=1 Tax=Apiospora arundinis TaxID=335852 RepID=A0ABR2HSE2_9PEZI